MDGSVSFHILGIECSIIFIIAMGFIAGELGMSLLVGLGSVLVITLHLLGASFPLATGTGVTALAGILLAAVVFKRRFNEIHLPVFLITLVAMLPLVELGARTAHVIAHNTPAFTNVIFRSLYFVFFLVFSFWYLRKNEQISYIFESSEKHLPPRIKITEVNYKPIYRSLWSIVAFGALAGYVTGLLGIAGVSLLIPFFIRALRMRESSAIITAFALSLVGASYAGVSHALRGHVDFFAALFLVAGGIVGVLLGNTLRARISAEVTRVLAAVLLLLSSVGLVLHQVFLTTARFSLPLMEIVTLSFHVFVFFVGTALIVLIQGGGILLARVFAKNEGKEESDTPTSPSPREPSPPARTSEPRPIVDTETEKQREERALIADADAFYKAVTEDVARDDDPPEPSTSFFTKPAKPPAKPEVKKKRRRRRIKRRSDS